VRELYTFADEQVAHRFVSVLQSLQLPAHAEHEGASWIVWIENDDHRDRAQELLTEFRANPDAEQFREAEKIAKQILAEKLEAEKSRQKLRKDLLDRWRGVWWKCHPAATTMVAISVFVVAISTELSPVKFTQRIIPLTCNVETSDIRNLLFIQETIMMVDEEGNDAAGFLNKPPAEVLKTWQIWRYVTPIFIHFNALHILFNMSWLRTLGNAIEFVRGTRRFLGLVLFVAVVSNVAQLIWSGPAFGGMSGVDFGLIGYIWMKGKTQPQYGLALPQQQVVMSMLWMLLCIGGAFGPIANAAHVGGFLAGIVIGARTAIWKTIVGPGRA
jgi:GlpG protein